MPETKPKPAPSGDRPLAADATDPTTGRRRRISRRRFLRSGSAALATAAGATATAGAVAAAGDPAGSSTHEPAASARATPAATRSRRLGMVIDTRRCIGCNACSIACKAENGVRLGGFRSWVAQLETGEYPRVTRHFLPRLCNHCQDPPCQRVCPVDATYKRAEDGLVDIDKTRCIGCRYCMVACPYGARYFNPRPDRDAARLFPARTRATVDKCNFCAHRIDHGLVPACVNTCLAGARLFGDLDDPDSEVHRAYHDPETVALLPELGTGPSVAYRGGNPRLFETDPGKPGPRAPASGGAAS